jgi:2-isopropylmalate synthase
LIWVLDATLREGEQTPGVYFDKHIKLEIANLLNDIGIDIIEAGHPIVTSEIYDAVRTIAGKGFNSVIGAHSRSVKKDVEAALECGVDFLGIFYCVSDERLNGVFRKDLNQAIEQISEVISYAKSQKPDLQIRYTPEDTVRSSFENVVKAAVGAVKAGADIISIADTTGFMVPGSQNNFYDFVTRLKSALKENGCEPKIAVHCHNDRGLALANALDGIRAGADIVDATVLSLGERAGIVDLAELLVLLNTSFNQANYNLTKLPELYNFVSKHCGIPVAKNYPIVGENAFTHCAGVHTHAAAKNPMHYESLNPELVNRQRKFSLDHMSGIASIKYALKILNIADLLPEEEIQVLDEVKKIGQRGRTVELSEVPLVVESIKHSKHFYKKTK